MNDKPQKPDRWNAAELGFYGLDFLFEIYGDLERQIVDFKEKAGIDCLRKCQTCCSTAKYVEASIFEMLPLSLHFWEEGRAEEILEKLEGVHPEALCISLNLHPRKRFRGGVPIIRSGRSSAASSGFPPPWINMANRSLPSASL